MISAFASYFFGVSGAFYFGIISVIIIAVLEGKKKAIIYASFYLFFLVLFGYGYVFGNLKAQADLNYYSHVLATWIAVITGVLMILGVAIWGLSKYYDELADLLKKYIQGINEINETKGELQDALKEKDRYFRELHHRIKNNLNSIMSMMYLKLTMTPDTILRNFVIETSQRIKAISGLHEQLMKLEEFDKLYSQEYLLSIIRNIQLAHQGKTQIKMGINIEDHKLNIDFLLSLGYLLNEILTNSFKHAYKDQTSGVINVSLKRFQDFFELIVEDFGRGFQSIKDENYLGLTLIKLLVEESKSEMEILHEKGTKYVIKIPIK
ncbi:MAG: sensor histidine kinase [Bacteroidota bacterium]